MRMYEWFVTFILIALVNRTRHPMYDQSSDRHTCSTCLVLSLTLRPTIVAYWMGKQRATDRFGRDSDRKCVKDALRCTSWTGALSRYASVSENENLSREASQNGRSHSLEKVFGYGMLHVCLHRELRGKSSRRPLPVLAERPATFPIECFSLQYSLFPISVFALRIQVQIVSLLHNDCKKVSFIYLFIYR